MYPYKLRSFLTFFVLFLCVKTIVNAQDSLYRGAKVIPPSPTSASLGKYGNTPVSLYKGTPDISIPMYNISTADQSLDIGLQYDASGTKVAQDASLVGLGWSLNAGGAITRVVRQGDDFSGHGYYNYGALPPNTPGNDYAYDPARGNLDRVYFDDVYLNQADAEPDVFSYNFAGYSGKFVLGKRNAGSIVYYDDKNNMDIIYTNGHWEATDAKGYKFYLGTPEHTQDYSRSSPVELTVFNGITGLNMSISSFPVTAWYIDSIVAPTGGKITFEYIYGKSLSLVQQSETLQKLGGITPLSGGCSPELYTQIQNEQHSYDASRQELRDVYLKRINYTNGSVEMKYSQRMDIEYLADRYPEQIVPSKLDSIIVKNAIGAKLKAWSFYYNYFNGSSIQGRLKLDSIIESGGTGEKKPPYVFTYYNLGLLPDKYSKAVDHWGYYNGVNNSTFLPTSVFINAPSSFYGADRSADTLHMFPMNGVLSDIKYPTGGTTKFEYELNDYSNLHGEQAYRTISNSATVRANPDINPHGDITDVTFHIPPPLGEPYHQIPITIQCSYQKVNPNVSDIVSLGYSNFWRIRPDNSLETIGGCTSANYNQPNPSPVFTNRNVDSGNYKIHLLSTSGWSFFMSVSWEEKEPIPLDNRKGAGIRIMRITDDDGMGTKRVKRYTYKGDDGKSSGVLMTPPLYACHYQVGGTEYYIGIGNVSSCSLVADFNAVLAQPGLVPGLSSKSGILGYTKVIELDGENGENGKTVYYYHNNEDAATLFPSTPTVGDPLNGKPDSVIVYNATQQPVKRNDYTYQVKETDILKGVKIWNVISFQTPAYYYLMKYYDNVSSWAVPVTEKETLFDGTRQLVTTKRYYYDNNTHRSPTRIDIDQSDGRQMVQKFKRPGDYPATSTPSFANQMKAVHLISPVVESQTFLQSGADTKLLGGTYTSYKKYYNKFFNPDVIYNIETATPLGSQQESSFATNGTPVMHPAYKPQAYFDVYDSVGNIIGTHKNNDVAETYLWGYKATYPVAKIIGVDYNTIKPYVNQNLLNNPASDQQLRDHLAALRLQFPAAIITYYTYLPQIGITSETDPTGKTTFYEYDGLGRLLRIKDNDGKILKVLNYQYQQPISQ